MRPRAWQKRLWQSRRGLPHRLRWLRQESWWWEQRARPQRRSMQQAVQEAAAAVQAVRAAPPPWMCPPCNHLVCRCLWRLSRRLWPPLQPLLCMMLQW